MQTYKLVYPTEHIKEVTMRRPTVNDRYKLLNVDSSIELEIQLIANLCDQTKAHILELDMLDYNELTNILADFTSSQT